MGCAAVSVGNRICDTMPEILIVSPEWLVKLERLNRRCLWHFQKQQGERYSKKHMVDVKAVENNSFTVITAKVNAAHGKPITRSQ